MNRAPATASLARSSLAGRTARDLMTTDPASLPEGATVGQVVAFLDEVHFGTAPVTDDAGHPVGVISRTDLFSCQPRPGPCCRARPAGSAGSGFPGARLGTGERPHVPDGPLGGNGDPGRRGGRAVGAT